MKEIMAIIRINKMNQTKRALSDAGIPSIIARDALGRGKGLVDMELLKGAEKGYEEASECSSSSNTNSARRSYRFGQLQWLGRRQGGVIVGMLRTDRIVQVMAKKSLQ